MYFPDITLHDVMTSCRCAFQTASCSFNEKCNSSLSQTPPLHLPRQSVRLGCHAYSSRTGMVTCDSTRLILLYSSAPGDNFHVACSQSHRARLVTGSPVRQLDYTAFMENKHHPLPVSSLSPRSSADRQQLMCVPEICSL